MSSAGVTQRTQVLQDLQLGVGGLQARDIGVQGINRLDDLPELGVAQVGVDLGGCLPAR